LIEDLRLHKKQAPTMDLLFSLVSLLLQGPTSTTDVRGRLVVAALMKLAVPPGEHLHACMQLKFVCKCDIHRNRPSPFSTPFRHRFVHDAQRREAGQAAEGQGRQTERGKEGGSKKA
jgi:hypothetical protein